MVPRVSVVLRVSVVPVPVVPVPVVPEAESENLETSVGTNPPCICVCKLCM